jgi:hypothetical protein
MPRSLPRPKGAAVSKARSRWAKGAAAAAVAVGSVPALAAGTASAVTSITWSNYRYGGRLEVYHSNTSNGAKADVYPSNGTNTPKWDPINTGQSYNGHVEYAFKNVNSGNNWSTMHFVEYPANSFGNGDYMLYNVGSGGYLCAEGGSPDYARVEYSAITSHCVWH